MTNPSENPRRSTFASTTGGVMTEEAGAITGDLEIHHRFEADGTRVMVRYAGANEWYTVSGGPVRELGEETRDQLVEHLTTPGPVVNGNERPVTLEGFPKA